MLGVPDAERASEAQNSRKILTGLASSVPSIRRDGALGLRQKTWEGLLSLPLQQSCTSVLAAMAGVINISTRFETQKSHNHSTPCAAKLLARLRSFSQCDDSA
eukprot:5334773-Amphidinium_carterae.1